MTNFDFILNAVLRLSFGGMFVWFVLRVIAREYRERVNGLRQTRKYLLGGLISFLAFSQASIVYMVCEAFDIPYDKPPMFAMMIYFNTIAFAFSVVSWILICSEQKGHK